MMTTQTKAGAAAAEPGQAELVLAQIDSLPTLPPVAVRLLELTTDDRSSAREVVQVVESDQSLSARLLAMVRKANLGMDVSTVERAVVLLGFQAVRNLVLSVQIFEVFSHRQERAQTRFNRLEFWKHCLAVGCAARLIAEQLGKGGGGRSRGPEGSRGMNPPQPPLVKGGLAGVAPPARRGAASAAPLANGGQGDALPPAGRGQGDASPQSARARGDSPPLGKGGLGGGPRPEDAFICGLVHDIGKVVLDGCFPKSYDRVIGRVEDCAACIADIERETFGLDHTQVGSRLAAHWRLPAMLAECIWLHHNLPGATPAGLAFSDHVRIVQVADRLARHMRIGYSGNHSPIEPFEDLTAAIGLSLEGLERVKSALPEMVAARAEFIGLDRLTSQDVYEGALAQANSELARANESLAETNRRLQQRSACFEAISDLRVAIGADPTHERVARASAATFARLLNLPRAAVVTYSPARGVLAVVAGGDDGGEAALEVVLASQVGDLGFMAQSHAGWLPGTLVPPTLVDRLTAALHAPPAWCLPIRNQHGFAAALCVGGEAPPEPGEMLDVVADWIGAWLGSVESAVAARRLNEELAETSRRLSASQAELARTRSLAMVGEMAAGAAHELNNPLAVISGRAQLLDREGAPEEVRKAAALISEHALKASGMVNELMEFAKPAPPQPTLWDVGTMLEEVRKAWLQKGVLKPAQFVLEIPRQLPLARADAGQLRRLFDELINNSVVAMGDNSSARLLVNCRADVADERLVIKVQDNGCGMTPEVLERAFTPFYSHRTAGRGRGLGLSRAARFAEVNGGHLRLNSRPGEGTQAILELPAGAL